MLQSYAKTIGELIHPHKEDHHHERPHMTVEEVRGKSNSPERQPEARKLSESSAAVVKGKENKKIETEAKDIPTIAHEVEETLGRMSPVRTQEIINKVISQFDIRNGKA